MSQKDLLRHEPGTLLFINADKHSGRSLHAHAAALRHRKKIARGRNTTRQSELFPCGEGFVIDTPGFSAFEITKDDDIRKEQLQHYFPEITDYFDKCRFAGCAHIREPGCAVRQRVKEGLIPKTRYLSYCKIYEDLARIKDWERK